jgi:hypothetical protein
MMTDDYFTRLEAQLGEVTERGAHLHGTPWRFAPRDRLSGALAIAACLIVAALVGAVALESGGARMRLRSGPLAVGSPARIDSALLAHFPLTRRPLRASDHLPAGYALQIGAARLGLVLGAARRVSFGAVQAWLIPGRRGACVSAVVDHDTALATCGTVGSDTLGLSSGEPSAGRLIGIVSDRVRALRYVPSSRAATRVAVHDGVFVVRAPVAGSIIATTSSGTRPLAVPSSTLAVPSSTLVGPIVPGRTASRVVDRVKLAAPHGARIPSGTAEVVTRRGQLGLVLVARGLPPNTASDGYAVWLTGGPSGHEELLGFVDRVGRNGKLKTAAALPPSARSYRQMIVTRERSTRPRRPGPVILSGRLAVP